MQFTGRIRVDVDGSSLGIDDEIGIIVSHCDAAVGFTTHAVGWRSFIDLITAAVDGSIRTTVDVGGTTANLCADEVGIG